MDRDKMLQVLQEIEEHRNRYKMGSSPKDVEKQHQRGKLTARERVELFFDPGTFQELNLWSFPFRTGYEIDERFSPADAVVVGYGKVDGRTVMTYAHDFTVLTGTQATVQHAKITKTIETAMKMGVPYVGIFDSAGIRLQDRQGEPGSRPPADGIGLHGTGSYMYSPPAASGVVPQIALMLGPQFAGSAYSPVLKDFLIMREGPGFMALASPPVIKAVTGAVVTNEEIGGAMMHAKISGTCDMVVQSDEEGIAVCRKMLGYWPSNWQEKPPLGALSDSPDRQEEELLDIVPFDLGKGYDMHRLISLLVDQGDYLEIKALYAPNIFTCFARMGGQSVGLIANNPEINGGAFDMKAADKEARFIRFCDAFNIPLVFLADTIGFLPDHKQQILGFDKQAAKVMYAICEATVPKITVYLRNCSGLGELTMGTEQMGVDLVLAWPNAQIGRVAPETAYEIYQKQGSEGVSESEIVDFVSKHNDIYHAGARSLFNEIIDPRKTRPMIISALNWLAGKTEKRPWRKHGNIPL